MTGRKGPIVRLAGTVDGTDTTGKTGQAAARIRTMDGARPTVGIIAMDATKVIAETPMAEETLTVEIRQGRISDTEKTWGSESPRIFRTTLTPG